MTRSLASSPRSPSGAGFVLLLASACAQTAPPPHTPTSITAPAQSAPDPRAACDGFEARAQRLWSEEARSAMRAGIASTGGTWNPAIADRLSARVSALAKEWVASSRAACADPVGGVRAHPAVYAQISACLDDRLVEQRTLVEVLTHSGPDQIAHADRVIATISADARACRKPAVYASYDESPDDTHAAVARERVAEALTQFGLEDPRASATATEALDAAAASPAVGPQIAALLVAAQVLALTRADRETQAVEALGMARRGGFAALEAEGLRILGREAEYAEEYSRALTLYEEAAAAAERAYGHDALATGRLLGAVGDVHSAKGDHARAREAYERALAVNTLAVGEDHIMTAALLSDLGQVFDALGDTPRALDAHQRALDVDQRLLGPEHPSVASDYTDLGMAYAHKNDHANAIVAFERALAIDEGTLGPEAPETAIACRKLGFAYADADDYTKAVPFLERALAIDLKNDGPEHASVGEDYANLGTLYAEQGKFPQALALFQKALATNERALGPDHPDTAVEYRSVGLVYREQARYRLALTMQQRALAIQVEALGSEHPETQETREAIAELCTTDRYAPACATSKR